MAWSGRRVRAVGASSPTSGTSNASTTVRAAETLALRDSVLRDLFGNRTRIRLEEVRENGGVTEGDFRIEVPDDVEVIDLR